MRWTTSARIRTRCSRQAFRSLATSSRRRLNSADAECSGRSPCSTDTLERQSEPERVESGSLDRRLGPWWPVLFPELRAWVTCSPG